jgi:hypothetical protein
LRRRTALLQQHADAFRARKETAKAVVTAEEARLRIQEALREADHGEDAGAAVADPAPATSEPAAKLERARAEAFRLAWSDRAANRHRSRPEADVLELRADPLGSDTRILFAEEPTGTITLLAVLEDAAAADEHHDAALDLACQLLEEIRDDGWPAESVAFADAESFISRFLPGRHPDVAARAAARAAAMTLTTLRDQASLSIARVAELAGLDQDQVKLLELRGAGYAEVEMLAAYARALGGTLRLTVELDGTGHIIL